MNENENEDVIITLSGFDHTHACGPECARNRATVAELKEKAAEGLETVQDFLTCWPQLLWALDRHTLAPLTEATPLMAHASITMLDYLESSIDPDLIEDPRVGTLLSNAPLLVRKLFIDGFVAGCKAVQGEKEKAGEKNGG